MLAKTKVATPQAYLESLDEPRRSEIARIDALIRRTVPKLQPVVWNGMLGYGPFHYRYATGREGDACKLAVASQKNYISIYACAVADGLYVAEKYAGDLGKASVGKSCIRFKKLEDLDLAVLKKLFRETARGSYGV